MKRNYPNLSDLTVPNEIAGANVGLRTGFVEKPKVILSLCPGVARLNR